MVAWGQEGEHTGSPLHGVGTATLHPDANRIEYRRDALTEWYLNDENGLEQGFTLATAPKSQPPNSKSQIILELALTGNLTAHLANDSTAVEFATSGGERVLRYGDFHATDATGRALPARLAIRNAQLAILVDDTAAAYPLTLASTITALSPTGLSLTPDWTAESNQTDAYFGWSVSTAGDVNGDGYSDVIVGAPHYDGGLIEEGRVYVYHGSASGLSTTADWTTEVNQVSAHFGESASLAGDINGDGYADVVVGAPLYQFGPETDEGAIFVYFGSASGLSSPSYQFRQSDVAGAHFGAAVAAAGDVDNDGYSDIIVGAPNYTDDQDEEGQAYVYYGSASGLSSEAPWTADGGQADAHFGQSVGPAGDVNSDGYADVIVGAPGYNSHTADDVGRAYVFHGSGSGPSTGYDWHAVGNQELGYFGQSVCTAGDVNGDGYSDVIVGEYRYTNGQDHEGRALVYHGSAGGLSTTPDWTAEADSEATYFGSSVSTAGDVNGDGYADVIVGASLYNNGLWGEGVAFVYHGSSGGLNTTFDWFAESNQYNARFGFSVSTAGDVNGDGYSDIIVGAIEYDNPETDEGAAFVYHGAAEGLSLTAGWTAESNKTDAHMGFSVGTAGDVNGDGYADVIVGAPGYDGGDPSEGRAYVYPGSSAGLNASPIWIFEGSQNGARFGTSVGTAGDVNGDGYADVIVGAPGYAMGSGQWDEGGAFVFHGSASGVSGIINWKQEGDQADAEFGTSVGTAGDVNGDGYSDIIVGAPLLDAGTEDEGRAYVYLGSENGLDTTWHWIYEINQYDAQFGISVGTAGDVNGDGYSDVIVGAHKLDIPELGYIDRGGVYVFHGSRSGLSGSGWFAFGDQQSAWFGFSVSTAGDVNGDGYSDVIVGAPRYNAGPGSEGRAYVYHGSASGLSSIADWTVEGNQYIGQLGRSVATAGDVNGDGYADVIVGAPLYDGGETNEGRAYAYHGSASGLSTIADWTAESDQADAEFGWSVGSAGDVNGDGYADVVVGARWHDNGHDEEGRAYLFYGNGAPGLSLWPRQRQIDGLTSIAPLGMTAYPEWVQLCLMRRMPLGRERVNLEWQIAPLGAPFTDTSIISGTVPGWSNTGSVLCMNINGLTAGTPYHWRIRTLYHPRNVMGQLAGRWIHIPWNGWNETDLRTVSINQPPVADAGDDRSVDRLASVTLDGSGSSDPDGDLPLTYHWMQTGGPAVTFTPNLSITTFTAPADPAVLTFTLVVTDSGGLPDPTPDEVVVTVTNQAPVAAAGPDQITDTLALITLDGSGSFDPDGDLPLIYHWMQTGGPAVTFTPNLSITTFTAPGDPAVLTFTLVVTDSGGLPDPTPDEVVVTVTNQAPVAAAGPDQITDTLALITLDGSGSFDPDGDYPLAYYWAQTGGPAVTFTPNLSITTFTAPGDPAVLTFTLVVTDSGGLPDPTPDEVVVAVTNQAPVATAGPDQITDTLALITLDGSDSFDPDGDYPLAYYWAQTGGPAVIFTPNLSITTFTAPGDPTVLIFTLVVTDSEGLPDPTPDEVVITVGGYRIYLPLVLR